MFLAGLMGAAKPPSTHSSSTVSAMPGICKELIGLSVARLRACSGTEESIADRLASDLNLVYAAVQTISELYDSLDEDSQENGETLSVDLKWSFRIDITFENTSRWAFFGGIFFWFESCIQYFRIPLYLDQTVNIKFSPAVFVCNSVAQNQLVKATTSIESAVFVTMQWLASIKPSSGLLYAIADELKTQVKKMGGFFQLLIQV